MKQDSGSNKGVSPLLSPHDITRLLQIPVSQCISDEYPWISNDEALIDKHLNDVCAHVIQQTHTQSRIEWDHYGSGYASFVDAWFYKNTPDFNAKHPIRYGEEHTGLTVLLSRLSPYFVLMESEKRWDVHGGGAGESPELEKVDRFDTPVVEALSQQVQVVLEKCGLIRVYKEQLVSPLPTSIHVQTLFTESGFTQFDALFYWED
ncbi:hypothetical protein [Pectobacterium parmentieri]|uniref:hypothetical protein n=1 Tax=Pectobacterium parmentieri TaxID=1905730 RepID=UPI0001B10031|nr:hypothetical protein [Pectobacterium parmentieri]ACX88238.1 conserved hypothetical protein [Pectobacterium parmentieri WPP163]AYH05932.1 hypothetical protein C5E25_11530 [Pectobacterium parmentieri]AYH14753.1 hypothetical protein C5E23_11500 [Pectobacterium parmentieri]AYH23454.1 hypothetical protein C5E21_11505 [Pectobacterium parmentieri]MBI0551441.1 hypothetical protein [Pectobacterium parmentieri]